MRGLQVDQIRAVPIVISGEEWMVPFEVAFQANMVCPYLWGSPAVLSRI